MKKILSALLFSAAVLLFADSWELKNMPAFHDHPGEIRIVPGDAQALAFYMIAPSDVISAKMDGAAAPGGEVAVIQSQTILGARDHRMTVEVTLPQGAEFLTSMAGDQPVEIRNGHQISVKGNVVTDCFVCDRAMLQPIGKMSEWKTYKIAIRLPEKAAAEPETLKLRVFHEGKFVAEKEWRIKRCAVPVAPPALKHIKIGFWDYGYYMLEKAHPELLKFWQKAGLNCAFREFKGADKDKFTLYGSLHHSNFGEPSGFPGYTPKGDRENAQLDGWYLRKYSLRQALPDIANLMKKYGDELGSSWVGMDYEPTGMSGFIPGSVADFKKEYSVSDEDFESMRQLLIKKGYSYTAVATPEQLETFKKWNHYQSSLHAVFIRELMKALHEKDPSMKFHNTTLDALPPPDVKGTGLGADASIQAKYLDMIEPQLYIGYDEVAAKYAMIRTREWKARVDELNPECILHPLLVVRYANGKTRNTPSRIRQQTIGALAEGAKGVSYYFLQCFDGDDWAPLADMVRQIAAVEDFYWSGKRCDSLFTVTGAPHRIAYQPQWPSGQREIADPDWHMTAHELNGKILVTLFNLNEKKECRFALKTGAKFQQITGGTWENGSVTVAPGEIAYLIFEK